MISQTATLTSKGQITIPSKIIKSAKLQKGHKLIFTLDGNYIRIEPAINMVRRLAGSLPTPKKFIGMDIDKIIQIAKEEHFANKKI